MKIFETDSIDVPPVSITRLEDDAEGQELLDKLDELRSEREEADTQAREARRPLPDLMAEADELAARVMVGDADPEDAEQAEEEVQKTKDRIDQFRRRVRQCDRAATLLKEKIEKREKELYADNAEAVRAVHRVLTRHALQAERRAATLLRLLREFEVRYARYSAGEEAEGYPRYLPEHARTQPPRSIMGPARTAGGNVFDSAEATAWMRRAAEIVDADPPEILDIESIDFESDDARLELLDPATDLDLDDEEEDEDASSPSAPDAAASDDEPDADSSGDSDPTEPSAETSSPEPADDADEASSSASGDDTEEAEDNEANGDEANGDGADGDEDEETSVQAKN